MAFDSSYGEVEEEKRGATRARARRRAEPSRGEASVRASCFVEVETRRDVTHEIKSRRNVTWHTRGE